MGIIYPDGIDNTGTDALNVPSAPENTPLSESGTSNRDHPQLHADNNAAILALEANASPLAHDHSGTDPSGLSLWPTHKLKQENTHESPDTDQSIAALHHTIDPTGSSPTKAAAATHTHDWISTPPTILNRPYIICTSLTRPQDPFLGLQIWETDTNCHRIWAQFPQQSAPIWQLLNDGAVPILRAECREKQQIVASSWGTTCIWDTIIEDIFGLFGWGPKHVVETVTGTTDVVISDAGHYHVHASICWDPAYHNFDHTSIWVTVNGQDIGRRNWEFVRGNGYAPGFSQTNEIYFHGYFNTGDVIRFVARHNSPSPCWLFFHDTSPDIQVCSMEVVFHAP